MKTIVECNEIPDAGECAIGVKSILAIDFEGSHRNPRLGAPIQIGVAVMEGAVVLASDEWLIRPPVNKTTGKPTREADAYALRVSGLTLERIEAEGLEPAETCHRLARFVANYANGLVNVAYNASYDLECYGQLLYSAGYYDRDMGCYVPFPEVLPPTWCDCYRASRSALPEMPSHSLEAVASHYGMARTGAIHGALEDAILCGRVWDRLARP